MGAAQPADKPADKPATRPANTLPHCRFCSATPNPCPNVAEFFAQTEGETLGPSILLACGAHRSAWDGPILNPQWRPMTEWTLVQVDRVYTAAVGEEEGHVLVRVKKVLKSKGAPRYVVERLLCHVAGDRVHRPGETLPSALTADKLVPWAGYSFSPLDHRDPKRGEGP